MTGNFMSFFTSIWHYWFIVVEGVSLYIFSASGCRKETDTFTRAQVLVGKSDTTPHWNKERKKEKDE